MSVTRRTALKGLGGLAGTAAMAPLLSGCDSSAGVRSTMVFMMMENRTYDHFLGSRSMLEGLPGNGLTMGTTLLDENGVPVGLSVPPRTPAGLCVLDPPHEWDPSRVQFNGGKNDGFVRAFQAAHPGQRGDVVMEYMTRDHLPVFYALADEYTTCDRWFASLLGPTLPNRLYWMGGQSNGAKSNGQVLAGAYVGIKTIFDSLDEKGIEWAYYYGDLSFLGFLPQFNTDPRIKPFESFLADAAAGKLPPVVYIDPSFSFNDYHPPHHPLVAEQLVSAAYTALSTSPHWASSTMVVTFDEHGGFYDHVPPGLAADDRADQGFDQLGFRVPTLVIGPSVKKGVVCSTPFEHTSVLRHIENSYGLAPLGKRDAAANDLSDCLQLDAVGRKGITMPAVEVDESQLGDCGGKAFDLHVMAEWAQARGIDLDKANRCGLDSVHAIGSYLDSRNLGRIRPGR